MTWLHPSDEGAATLYYNIRHKVTTAGNDTWVERSVLINRNLDSQSLTFEGLTSGTDYTFQVQAHNVNGPGPRKTTTRTLN